MNHEPADLSREVCCAILSRLVAALPTEMPAEAARLFLQIEFAEEDKARINALVARSQTDELTAAEVVELRLYADLGDLLSLLHSKARRALGVS